MDRLGNLLHRPRAYCNIDGVGELGIGFICLAYALLQWLQVHSPRNSMWNQMYTLFIYVGVMCAITHYGTKAIKNRFTYPRTGFVSYRKRDTVWIPLIVGCATGALVSAGLVMASRSHWNMTTPTALIGLVFAAAYAYGIARTARWKWAVVWVMAFGSVVIAFLPPDVLGSLARGSWVTHLFPANFVGAFLLCMALYGSLLLVSGAISFWLYLRATPIPSKDPE